MRSAGDHVVPLPKGDVSSQRNGYDDLIGCRIGYVGANLQIPGICCQALFPYRTIPCSA